MVLFTLPMLTAQTVVPVTQQPTDVGKTTAIETPRYTYYPNLEAYFDTQTHLYIYKVQGLWVSTPTIAANYKGYCLRNGFNVPLEGYVGETPYVLLAKHQLQFPAEFSSKRRPKVVIALK